jgi:hypothetical protein
MERVCEEGKKMRTTDYDMINEFAIRHFPSNTAFKKTIRRGEGLRDGKNRIHRKKTSLHFTYTNLFSVFLE